MPAEIKITTELLFKAAGIFALIDIVYVPLLSWRLRREFFGQMKWSLAVTSGVVWWSIWNWAIGNFWETVYRYVFPAWAQTWVPPIAAVVAPLVTLGLWTMACRAPRNPVLVYCLLGGALGALSHVWAVYRGIVSNPPMLQGASPVAAVVIAFFEYMFYYCVILTLAGLAEWARIRLKST
jgi:hypothetical protein